MDMQMITGATVIDLKKALDLVDHECLLFKLEHYRGISVDIYIVLVDISTKISLACRPTNQSDNADVH